MVAEEEEEEDGGGGRSCLKMPRTVTDRRKKGQFSSKSPKVQFPTKNGNGEGQTEFELTGHLYKGQGRKKR